MPDASSPLHAPTPAGEFAFWLGPSVDVLPYYGPVAARAVMHDHELWLHPSSLEGRGLPRPTLQDRVRPSAGGFASHGRAPTCLLQPGWVGEDTCQPCVCVVHLVRLSILINNLACPAPCTGAQAGRGDDQLRGIHCRCS